MFRLAILWLSLFFNNLVPTQENVILNPPRSSREFKYLFVTGLNFFGSSKMFIYANQYDIAREQETRELDGTVYSFDSVYLKIHGDWQIFFVDLDSARLLDEYNSQLEGKNKPVKKIEIFDLGEKDEIILPPQFLFLKANAPAPDPDSGQWRVGETRRYGPDVIAYGLPRVANNKIEPQEARVIIK